MNGNEFFHESVVRDIVDILTSMKDFDEVQFINNAKANRSFKSITSATKDLILTFPVMVSTDIEPDVAIMIAKAQEKKMASLLHILFTAISVGNNEDVFDYVKKFHSNLGSLGSSLDDYVDGMDRLATTFGEAYDQTMRIDHDVLNAVLENLKDSNHVLGDDVRESSLEAYKILPGYTAGRNVIVKEEAQVFNEWRNNGDGIQFHDRNDAVGYLANHGFDVDSVITTNSTYVDTYGRNQTVSSALLARLQAAQAYVRSADTAPPERVTRQLGASSSKMSGADMAKYMADMTKAHNAVVLNNEYKKANELQPTMMVVNFMRHSDESGDTINTAVIGIKCKIYAVTSADLCNRISGKLQDKSVLTNFVRATTNEIAFFRDFLFAVDQAKFDAKSYGKNASSNKMWKVLERRSLKSKFRRSLKMYNDATAITTLVLSENDAEYLKLNGSVDIMNVSNARKILDAYNFMCICVANQSTEVASLLYDTGDDTYESLPFSGLEREASDNSYKKMVNLMAKISR